MRCQQYRLLLLIISLMLFLPACGSKHAPKGVNYGASDYQAAQAVRAASSQMGNRYTAGGVSPQQGFDCSGLVFWAYRSNGVYVPRKTADQAMIGRNVTGSSPHLGDIIVFNTGGRGSGLHTALYAGRNEFIHSPKPGAVIRKDNLNNPYWHKRVVCVRRVSAQ